MKLELREYQKRICETCKEKNCLVVLPTGLGKTFIAIELSRQRLEKFPGSKVLILAPTKPLVNQHKKTFKEFFPDYDLIALTGKINPDKRNTLWERNQIIFATPQTIEKDLTSKKVSLEDVSLLVEDEAHHAIRKYSYVYVAKKYVELSRFPRIIGMTASPGESEEKIKEICSNLFLEKVETRTEEDEDVKEYVYDKQFIEVKVELPKEFQLISDYLKKIEDERRNELLNFSFIGKRLYRKIDLLNLQKRLVREVGKKKFYALKPLSLVTQIIKLRYAKELIQTQGSESLFNYIKKLKTQKAKSTSKLLLNEDFCRAVSLTEKLIQNGANHPKYEKLIEILNKEFLNKNTKIIIFTNYRETGNMVKLAIKGNNDIKPALFIGQAGKGLSQKEQIEILERFKEGEYNVLIATSIGEEGLHIKDADIGIFFEPVPSALRMIQRAGRIGRTKFGKIYILMTKDCIDEGYFYISKRKEKKMKTMLNNIKLKPVKKQKSLEGFFK